MEVTAVIGANYGDEGKGLMVDYLAHQQEPGIVVRHNGGAQAGHTVVTPEGARHVFSHFGSGTFAGWPTFLDKGFFVDPEAYCVEARMLHNLDTTPLVFAHPNARVVTPFDILLNQEAESSRGDKRHGSCGCGIFETFNRSSYRDGRYRLEVRDLTDLDSARYRLEEIRTTWVPKRLRELGLIPSEAFQTKVQAPRTIDHFLQWAGEFLRSVGHGPREILHDFGRIIFEGAQGLELSQRNWSQQPHLTPSYTGLENVIDVLRRLSFYGDLHAVYVTRSYLTRHGSGPLPNEDPDLSYPDDTNDPNEFQGALRFAPLDGDALRQRISKDAIRFFKEPGLRIVDSIAVTHLDQQPIGVEALARHLHMKRAFASNGPTRADVAEVPLGRAVAAPKAGKA